MGEYATLVPANTCSFTPANAYCHARSSSSNSEFMTSVHDKCLNLLLTPIYRYLAKFGNELNRYQYVILRQDIIPVIKVLTFALAIHVANPKPVTVLNVKT